MIGNRLSDHEKVKFESDPFAILRQQNANQQSNILLQDKLARSRDADKFKYNMALQALKNRNQSKRGSLTGKSYSLTEEVHHDGLYTAIVNRGIPVPKLIEDEKGNLVPAKLENGRYIPAKANEKSKW